MPNPHTFTGDPKILLTLVALLALSTSVSAQNEWNTVYKEINARIKAPVFKEKVYKAAVKTTNPAKKNQQLVNFVRCENVLIENLRLLNSPFWVIHPLFCKSHDINIDNLTVSAKLK